MINPKLLSRIFGTLLIGIFMLSGFQAHAQAASATIVVNADVSTGAIKYGGIGWLYGLGENDYVLDSKITALVHPGYSGQRAPNGTQHDYGDVLNVVAQAERVEMLGVDIYVQDYYAEWPYPNYGIDSYIENVVNPVNDAVVASSYHRTLMRYVPFNEPDWMWYATSGPKFAQILGPGFMHYNAPAYDAFIAYCQENDRLSDVITWHELSDDFFDVCYLNYDNYRRIEQKYGITEREVYINEYRRQNLDIPCPDSSFSASHALKTPKSGQRWPSGQAGTSWMTCSPMRASSKDAKPARTGSTSGTAK